MSSNNSASISCFSSSVSFGGAGVGGVGFGLGGDVGREGRPVVGSSNSGTTYGSSGTSRSMLENSQLFVEN